MPMDRSKYPPEWNGIAKQIKEQAEWQCEQCGLKCRRPGEQFDTHKRTLTVAHINHVEMDCRPENLVALCPRCHLAYDQTRKRMQRLAWKRINKISLTKAIQTDEL
jgi:5-methylcytosine-specific restriction endonuclease McrA